MSTDKPTRRGRIDWEKVNAKTAADIERDAAEDDIALGLDRSKLRYSQVLNIAAPDLQRLRKELGLSQSEFATTFGISVRTVQQWEQRRATPDQPAKLLLRLISLAPGLVSFAVEDAIAKKSAAKTPILSPLTIDVLTRLLKQEIPEAPHFYSGSHEIREGSPISNPDPNANAVYAA